MEWLALLMSLLVVSLTVFIGLVIAMLVMGTGTWGIQQITLIITFLICIQNSHEKDL
jgi:hypothetical protein